MVDSYSMPPQTQKSQGSPVLGWIMIAAGLIILGVGGYQVVVSAQWLVRSVRASGTIIRLVQSPHRNPGDATSCVRIETDPVIRFTDRNGVQHDFTAAGRRTLTGSGCVGLDGKPQKIPNIQIAPLPEVGSTRAVRYDPQNPGDGREDSLSGIWMLPLMMVGVGLVIGTVGWLFTRPGGKLPQTGP